MEKFIVGICSLILGILVILFFIFLLSFIMAFPVMWLWNFVMPSTFGLPVLGYWKSWALYLLCSCLFKSVCNNKNNND